VPRADGIDVSQYQGVIDWAAVRSAGLQWVGMRVCHGYIDTQFARNRQGASWARHRLLYDYMDPGGNADTFLATIGQLQPGEAAMLDAEASGLTVADCVRWCEQVEHATGRPAVVYTGKYVSGGSIWSSPAIFNGQRARILAAYTSEAKARALAAPYGWDAWQWSSTGSIPGIGGNVDLNQVDNLAAFDRCCGTGAPPKAACLFGYPCPWA
jgi:lysozyme